MSLEDTNLDDELELEIEDDTPEEDRGREPMPEHIVQNLESDELDEYDSTVKEKLKQLKKVWHDERRAKEAAYREREEAVRIIQHLHDENQRIKSVYNTGEQEYINTALQAAALEVEACKKMFREAYEAGDPDALVDAQNNLQIANLKLLKAKGLKPNPLQTDDNIVKHIQEPQQARQPQPGPDQKALAWQNRNPWFGSDEEMTATALGLHEKLKNQGVEVGSDEYYEALDKTMRKRFVEYFGEKPKAKNVVAPASRSTSSNKVRLSASQVQLAKRLGITPEMYAKELLKLEKNNG